jgi:RIO-like serine/threonine protein kinase
MLTALAGHSEATTKAKILHRDISVGNILITPDGNGILIDWELSKDLTAKTEARLNERTVCLEFFLYSLSHG